jgi:hypothetical protein
MGRKLIKPEPWWADATMLMVKHDISLRQAAQELGVELTIEEADAIKDRKLFKECLDEARLAYFTEVGSSPKLTKEVVVGQIYQLARRLAEDREDYKAADALLKLSKVQGWVGETPDSLTRVFSTLSQNDIDRLKERLREKAQQQSNALETDLKTCEEGPN